jgi:hypothetical protein
MKYLLRILLLLFLLILIIPRLSYSQDDTISATNPQVCRNGIKGMPLIVPVPFFYAGLSVGYERYISKHHVMEFCGYYYFNIDEMGAKSHSFSYNAGL